MVKITVRVEYPSYFFLDDDFLPFPDATEKHMTVCDMDIKGEIGGVCAAEATRSPLELDSKARTDFRDRFKLRIAGIRQVLENRFVPDSFIAIKDSLCHLE